MKKTEVQREANTPAVWPPNCSAISNGGRANSTSNFLAQNIFDHCHGASTGQVLITSRYQSWRGVWQSQLTSKNGHAKNYYRFDRLSNSRSKSRQLRP